MVDREEAHISRFLIFAPIFNFEPEWRQGQITTVFMDSDLILTNKSLKAKHLQGEAVTENARQAFRLTAITPTKG